MNSLLKRQIRKYLSAELSENKDLEKFIDAVDRSYNNFDDQFAMIQRATAISSEELFLANKELRLKAEAQLKVINKLKKVIDTLKFYELPEGNNIDNLELDGAKLVDFIDSQTKDIVEINKQREKLLKDLAIQNQELSDYAHMVSHDLKSPLRSIDALSAWLKEDYLDVLDEGGKDSIALIRAHVEKMDALISGILEYSTIGKTYMENYSVDLNIILKEVLSVVNIPSHIKINVSDLPVIQGDKYRLQQLFQNLIDNAIKYNDKEKGEIKIEVSDNGGFWKFCISDNGKGIEEAYFKKIFKTFQKLENNIDSTGIGLSIVKKIIDLYKGEIWVTSELHKGTHFYFTLKK